MRLPVSGAVFSIATNGSTYETIKAAAKAINMKAPTLQAMLSGVNRNKTTLRYLKPEHG